MYKATCTSDGEWEGEVVPFGNLELSPSAQVLNYGQVRGPRGRAREPGPAAAPGPAAVP